MGDKMSDKTNEPVKELKGLTEQEAALRVEQGLDNRADTTTDKSIKEIIFSNAFTYFNLIFLIISILLLCVKSYRNLTFLPIVIGNTLIGIVQELRAKRILDKMNLLNAPHATVIREGIQKQILSEELVKDDVVVLRAGDQICADAIVIKGNVQVNESLLTGEADEIEKQTGMPLLSGSFVVAGECYARLDKVGKDSYISRLATQAKSMGSGEQSEMVRSINQIVKWVGIIIIPISIILFYQSFYINHTTMQKGVTSTVAAIIGMIPEGLYLLTTIALALSTMRLAKNKVLLHDMKSIETLARVDVLCVDKTGTITEPSMCVKEIHAFSGKNEHTAGQYSRFDEAEQSTRFHETELEALLADYVRASKDNNATMQALKAYMAQNIGKNDNAVNYKNTDTENRQAVEVFPFSSAVKYSGVVFNDGAYVLGAPEFVMQSHFSEVEQELLPYTKKGYRVLIFARYAGRDLKNGLTEEVTPLGFIVLSNPIRANAKETFAYFKAQGVQIKVISGDNPETVSEIAKQAGIEGAQNYIDATRLDSQFKIEEAVREYTVFGRVTPKQKQQLVQALQKDKHTVAMTGDGVNDILAMKDVDCSVAMASGSEAASQAAQVVLLDSDFAHMPSVVWEGRRVVNNVERSASLFLVKNIFSLLMSVFSAVFMITYPLEPAHISLISMFTIGIPGFLLALEPNKERIKGKFIKKVLLKALPAGLTDVFVVGALVICGDVFSLPSADIATAATLLLAVVGFMILIKISEPFNKMKYAILFGNIAGLLFCGIMLNHLFAMSQLSAICMLLLIVFGFAAESLFRYLTLLVEKADEWVEKKSRTRL